MLKLLAFVVLSQLHGNYERQVLSDFVVTEDSAQVAEEALCQAIISSTGDAMLMDFESISHWDLVNSKLRHVLLDAREIYKKRPRNQPYWAKLDSSSQDEDFALTTSSGTIAVFDRNSWTSKAPENPILFETGQTILEIKY